MGNVPLQGNVVEEVDKDLKKNKNIGHVQAVFPSDSIITTLYTGIPAACIGILLFFNNTSQGEYSIICQPLNKTVNVRTDFRFIASYCWGRMYDTSVDPVTGYPIENSRIDLFYISYYPYILFLLCFLGILLKYLFVGFSGSIGKEVEYVIHGVEEASSFLLAKLIPKEDSIQAETETDIEETGFFNGGLNIPSNTFSVAYSNNGSKSDFEVENNNDMIIKWKSEERNHFKMFESYINSRSKRSRMIFQIFSTRIFCILITSSISYLLHLYFIRDIYSSDGRVITDAFQCLLPKEYWEIQTESDLHPDGYVITIDTCYFKGRPTTAMFNYFCIFGYACANIGMFMTLLIDYFFVLGRARVILQHLPLMVEDKSISDLDVIMSFVKIHPKPATLSVYRMMSGLNRQEEMFYRTYLKEFILWIHTDEGIDDILDNIGFDHFDQKSVKKKK